MKKSQTGGCPVAHHNIEEVKDGSGLIDALPFPVILLDGVGKIKSVNENVERVLGYESDSLVGRSYFEVFHSEEKMNEAFREVAKTLGRSHEGFKQEDFWRWVMGVGSVYEREWIFLSREGRHVNANGRFAPMKESGDIIVSFFDVSNYWNIINKLEDAEKKTRMIFETAVDGFITINEKGIVQSFNQAAEKLFGYTAVEVIGENVKMLMPHQYSVEHDQYLSNYKETKKAKIIGKGREVVGKRKDGSTFPMYLSVGEGKLSGGRTMYTGIVRDLSEYKKSEIELKKTNENLEIQNKIKTDIGRVVEASRGTNSLAELADRAIGKLAEVTKSSYGTFYVKEEGRVDDDDVYRLMGTYAFTKRKNIVSEVRSGEGILGQVVLEKKTIILEKVPREHITIGTSLGESAPNNLIIVPVVFEGSLLGFFELASFKEYGESDRDFLEQTATAFAPNIQSALGHQRTKKLLDKSNKLSEELKAQQGELEKSNEELQMQQEELRKKNEELQERQEDLKRNNENLKAKEEELRSINERLVEREEELRVNMESQKKLTERLKAQKSEVEASKKALEQKAGQLEQTSGFKSQFLANMSHELRTPLNSLLILAKLLSENREKNLTEKQVENARLIHNSGAELLSLINDILDLAKVESGKMLVSEDKVNLKGLNAYIEQTFKNFAQGKQLEFKVERKNGVPDWLVTDEVKLKQILKNLLSNAFKFTEKGQVRFSIEPGEGEMVAFSVSDTGIGIPEESQKEIFEAFRQVDGTIQRKYGGTGLGMTISNEYAKLLGGEIRVTSAQGKGSTFVLSLPRSGGVRGELSIGKVQEEVPVVVEPMMDVKCEDDRETIEEGEAVVLVVEDDVAFAKILVEIAKRHGLKAVHTMHGKEVINLCQQYNPRAIILDLFLPDCHGYAILDKLKLNKNTRHVPVHIVSFDPNRRETLGKGAVSVLQKPICEGELELLMDKIDKQDESCGCSERRVLLVEDDSAQRNGLRQLFEGEGLIVDEARTGEEAIEKLKENKYRCVILDLGLPDGSGYSLLKDENFKQTLDRTPVIVYTGRELSPEVSRDLEMMSKRVILKDADSYERLREEVSLFFQEVSTLDEGMEKLFKGMKESDLSLEGKRILIVDDDVRNIFAITSYLEVYGMDIMYAENGKEALDILEREHEDMDIVLMDIMMPEMDGYTAIRKIRETECMKDLPVIALTAKAMKGDKEECLRIGASDYISKPVDTDKLVSLMKVWVSRKEYV